MLVDGWFIYRASDDEMRNGTRAKLVREKFEMTPPGDDQIIAAPIYGCWEGNMGHSILRRPIDICRARGEDRVIIGNAAVMEVVEVGSRVKTVRPGQKVVLFCNGDEDWFGYPNTILGYDTPGAMGCMAKLMKVRERQVVPIPDNTAHDLKRWAGFSLRYITAWSNWELAHGTYRLSVSANELAAINVWGWGGGVTLAELDLAKRFGARAVMLTASDSRIEMLKEMDIQPLDRRRYGDLNFDQERYKTDPDYADQYRQGEKAFLEDVAEMTKGRKVQIFVDMIGEPVYRATLKALAREGVVTTAGWKEGMSLNFIRAIECIERHQHIHTHYARYVQGWQAVAFAEGNGWLPPMPEKVYSFDDIPLLCEDYLTGRTEYFPIFSINAAEG